MKKYIDNEKIFDRIQIDKNDDAVSATETTGLMPSLPHSEYEISSYKEIDEYNQRPIAGQHSNKSHQEKQ